MQAAAPVVRTTVRLPAALDDRLNDYCARTGAVRNRVVAIALATFLNDDAPALHVQPFTDDELRTLRALAARAAEPREDEFVRLVKDTFDAREVPVE